MTTPDAIRASDECTGTYRCCRECAAQEVWHLQRGLDEARAKLARVEALVEEYAVWGKPRRVHRRIRRDRLPGRLGWHPVRPRLLDPTTPASYGLRAGGNATTLSATCAPDTQGR